MNALTTRLHALILGATVTGIFTLQYRLLIPFVAPTLYLGSAIIGINIIAIVLGLLLGFPRENTATRPVITGILVMVAGALFGTSAVLSSFITDTFGAWDPQAAIPVWLALFSVPGFACLGISAAQTLAQRQAETGSNRRSVLFWIVDVMIGIVAGFPLTVYILTPAFGVGTSFPVFGIVQIVAGALSLRKGPRSFPSVILLTIGTGIFGAVGSQEPTYREATVLVREHEAAGEYEIMENNFGRHLLINGRLRARYDTSTFQSDQPTMGVLEIPKYLFENPGRLLLAGAGAGYLYNTYQGVGWQATVLEEDRMLLRYAREYFHTPIPEEDIRASDVRGYLRNSADIYDLIIFDDIVHLAAPERLLTDESFAKVRARLAEEGVFALNIPASGWNDIIVRSTALTLQNHFYFVIVLPMEEPPDQFGNVILLASNRPLELVRELEYDYRDPDYRFSIRYHRNHAWDNQFIPDARGAVVQTDDRNSIPLWLNRLFNEERHELREYLALNRMLW